MVVHKQLTGQKRIQIPYLKQKKKGGKLEKPEVKLGKVIFVSKSCKQSPIHYLINLFLLTHIF